jgi:hypothetical protein
MYNIRPRREIPSLQDLTTKAICDTKMRYRSGDIPEECDVYVIQEKERRLEARENARRHALEFGKFLLDSIPMPLDDDEYNDDGRWYDTVTVIGPQGEHYYSFGANIRDYITKYYNGRGIDGWVEFLENFTYEYDNFPGVRRYITNEGLWQGTTKDFVRKIKRRFDKLPAREPTRYNIDPIEGGGSGGVGMDDDTASNVEDFGKFLAFYWLKNTSLKDGGSIYDLAKQARQEYLKELGRRSSKRKMTREDFESMLRLAEYMIAQYESFPSTLPSNLNDIPEYVRKSIVEADKKESKEHILINWRELKAALERASVNTFNEFKRLYYKRLLEALPTENDPNRFKTVGEYIDFAKRVNDGIDYEELTRMGQYGDTYIDPYYGIDLKAPADIKMIRNNILDQKTIEPTKTLFTTMLKSFDSKKFKTIQDFIDFEDETRYRQDEARGKHLRITPRFPEIAPLLKKAIQEQNRLLYIASQDESVDTVIEFGLFLIEWIRAEQYIKGGIISIVEEVFNSYSSVTSRNLSSSERNEIALLAVFMLHRLTQSKIHGDDFPMTKSQSLNFVTKLYDEMKAINARILLPSEEITIETNDYIDKLLNYYVSESKDEEAIRLHQVAERAEKKRQMASERRERALQVRREEEERRTQIAARAHAKRQAEAEERARALEVGREERARIHQLEQTRRAEESAQMRIRLAEEEERLRQAEEVARVAEAEEEARRQEFAEVTRMADRRELARERERERLRRMEESERIRRLEEAREFHRRRTEGARDTLLRYQEEHAKLPKYSDGGPLPAYNVLYPPRYHDKVVYGDESDDSEDGGGEYDEIDYIPLQLLPGEKSIFTSL